MGLLRSLSESRLREIRTSGLMSGKGKRSNWPCLKPPRPSSTLPESEDYALELIVADMIELVDSIGAEKAVWVGHDWGAPVVWSLARHHPERCHGVAALSVPYIPEGFSVNVLLPLIDRSLYPEDKYPYGQWDYQVFYLENFARASAGFEADVRATVRALFRSGKPDGRGKPNRTAFVRANGGWFGPDNKPLALPRDERVIDEEAEASYVAALSRNGFFGPDSWYLNGETNADYAERARKNWRLTMPTLFLHGAYDYTCETIDSPLAEPMRASCADLTESVVPSGHWMAQEKPAHVNAVLAGWLAQKRPDFWLRG